MVAAQINKWGVRIIALCWIIYSFLLYLPNSYYGSAIAHFQYYGLLGVLIVAFLLAAILLSSKRKFSLRVEYESLNGLKLYGVLMSFILIILIFYATNNKLLDADVKDFGYLILHILGIHLFFIALTAMVYGIGNVVLRQFGLSLHPMSQTVVSIVLGFSILSLVLFFIGTTGFLNIWVVAPLLLIIAGLTYKSCLRFIHVSFIKPMPRFELPVIFLFPVFILLLFIAMNVLSIIRPFPIGFDALNHYMNVPHLIADYEALTQGGGAYYWSIIMSLGFILFDSTPVTLSLSIYPAILALFAFFRMSRMVLSKEWSLVVIALLYTTPFILWQSNNEAKIDLALLFIASAPVLLLLEYSKANFSTTQLARFINRIKLLGGLDPVLWILLGWLVGFAFGVKYTMMFLFVAMIAVMFYRNTGKLGVILFILLIMYMGVSAKTISILIHPNRSFYPGHPRFFLGVVLPFGLFFGIILWKRRHGFIRVVRQSILFLFIFLLPIIPWMIKNTIDSGAFSVGNVLSGKGAAPKFYEGIEKDGETSSLNKEYRPMFASNSMDIGAEPEPEQISKEEKGKKNKKNKRTRSGTEEEVSRYMGYEPMAIRYLSIFYDLTAKTNVNLMAVDSGFILFMVLPLLLFARIKNRWWENLLGAIALLVLLVISINSVYFPKAEPNLQGALALLGKTNMGGNQVFSTVLLPAFKFIQHKLIIIGQQFLPIYKKLIVQFDEIGTLLAMFIMVGFMVLLYRNLRSIGSGLNTLLVILVSFFLLWLLSAQGIIWYGSLAIAIGLVVILTLTKDSSLSICSDKVIRFTIYGAIGVGLAFSAFVRLSDLGALNTRKITDATAENILRKSFVEYGMGKVSGDEVLRRLNPGAYYVPNVINRENKSKIIRIGTYVNYFIDRNDARVMQDNQLDGFIGLVESFPTKTLLVKHLKERGIRYIIVDLSTKSIDRTKGKSLAQKYDLLLGFLYQNPGIKEVFTDQLVYDPQSPQTMEIKGQVVPVRPTIFGKQVVKQGQIALFEVF